MGGDDFGGWEAEWNANILGSKEGGPEIVVHYINCHPGGTIGDNRGRRSFTTGLSAVSAEVGPL